MSIHSMTPGDTRPPATSHRRVDMAMLTACASSSIAAIEPASGWFLVWAPRPFPRKRTAPAHFDGSPLYEYADPRKAEHRDWGTLVFNYDRPEVRSFLISSACAWLEDFHIDGLRVDAVASMLYLDYSRKGADWVPNREGGNRNLEAIEFLRELNAVTHLEFPGSVTLAEESTRC